MKTLFILLLIMSANSFAFKLEPMVADFTPQGTGSTKIFRIDNEGKDRVAIKIEAFVRKIDANGKEKRVPTKHFKIYPEQLSLSPSDSRAIRVTYLGPKVLEEEAAYRIVATQLPIKFKNKTKQSGISFLFQFVASVYVTSENFIPKLEVASVKNIGADRVKIKIANKGKKHRQLKDVKVLLKNKQGQTLALNDSVIKNWSSGNILAGGQRSYTVKSNIKFDLKKKGAVAEIIDEK